MHPRAPARKNRVKKTCKPGCVGETEAQRSPGGAWHEKGNRGSASGKRHLASRTKTESQDRQQHTRGAKGTLKPSWPQAGASGIRIRKSYQYGKVCAGKKSISKTTRPPGRQSRTETTGLIDLALVKKGKGNRGSVISFRSYLKR